MANSLFTRFHQEFPPNGDRVPFDALKHNPIAENIPVPLTTEWQNFGFGSYGNGFIWLPEPDKPILDYQDWSVLDGTGIEVLRTAFANICIWQRGEFIWLNPYTGNSTNFPIQVETLFETSLVNKYFRKNILWEKLFKQANKKLGTLASDECYGFAPLPTLGGAVAEEYLIKVKMREYLVLLAQTI